jgi:hypothetical protein
MAVSRHIDAVAASLTTGTTVGVVDSAIGKIIFAPPLIVDADRARTY